MSRVNLDLAPEAIRQFVLSLVTPEGTVLETAGKSVGRVSEFDHSASDPAVPRGLLNQIEAPATAFWSEDMNCRRVFLIQRKYSIGLTPDEREELAILKMALRCYIDRVAPRPLEALREMHRELLEISMKDATEVGS